MNYKIAHSTKDISGKINLPSSKSISNRLLIINEISENKSDIQNLSQAQDTQILKQILANKNSQKIVDVDNAGTAMRFLTAYFATIDGERILTGSDRMKQRPIENLVEALKTIGADIEYLEKNGFPPLKIKGKKLKGGTIKIDASVSSQFISALLMIAPQLQNELKIIFQNKKISMPYIEMTLMLMNDFGIKYLLNENEIIIPKQHYNNYKDIIVEPDWTAASYWYAMVALANHAEIYLKGLKQNSKQGDKIVPELFQSFGVNTKYLDDGILLTKNSQIIKSFEFDFTNNPDIAQTIAVVLAAKGIEGVLKGVKSLKIKETDRVEALKSELQKIGTKLEIINNDSIKIIPEKINGETVKINTYNDHRMAMAFTPLALILNAVVIENPFVVEKSYPSFWNDLQNMNFDINTI